MNPNCDGCKEESKNGLITCQILKKEIRLEICNNFSQKGKRKRKIKAHWKHKKD